MLIAQISVPPVLAVPPTPSSIELRCPIVSTYMALGDTHSPREVAQLQSFLKNAEQLDVEITGSFDVRTRAAVEKFQRKYMSDTMAPWGATRPSGVVNITTAKKVNSLACNIPMTLSAAELGVIEAYKARLVMVNASASAASPAAAVETVPVVVAMPEPDSGVSIGVGTGAGVGPVLTEGSGSLTYRPDVAESNAASVSGSSMGSRFWAYVRGLFGR